MNWQISLHVKVAVTNWRRFIPLLTPFLFTALRPHQSICCPYKQCTDEQLVKLLGNYFDGRCDFLFLMNVDL